MNFPKAFTITLFSQIIIILSGIMNNIIIARRFGPEGNGVYSMVITTSVLLLIFSGAGLVTSNTYWVKKNRDEVSIIFVNSLVFAMGVSILIFLSYVFFAKEIMCRFFSKDIAFVIALSLPFLLIQEYNQGILWGLQRYGYYSFLNIFRAVGLACAIVILILLMRLDIKAAILGWFLVISLSSVISIFILWKNVGITWIYPRLSILIRSLKMGIKSLMIDIVWFLSLRIDLYLVAYFLGIKAAGIYSLAAFFIQTANIIPIILGRFIFNSLIGDDRKQEFFVINLIKISLLYSIIFSLGVILVGKFTIELFFGAAFAQAFGCLIFLLPAAVIQSINTGISYFIAGKKAIPIYSVFATISTLICNIIFSFWLIPRLGIKGAALSSSFSQLVNLILYLLILKKYNLKLHFMRAPSFKGALG